MVVVVVGGGGGSTQDPRTALLMLPVSVSIPTERELGSQVRITAGAGALLPSPACAAACGSGGANGWSEPCQVHPPRTPAARAQPLLFDTTPHPPLRWRGWGVVPPDGAHHSSLGRPRPTTDRLGTLAPIYFLLTGEGQEFQGKVTRKKCLIVELEPNDSIDGLSFCKNS